MPVPRRPFRKALSAVVSTAVFLTQSLFVHASERSFWAERAESSRRMRAAFDGESRAGDRARQLMAGLAAPGPVRADWMSEEVTRAFVPATAGELGAASVPAGRGLSAVADAVSRVAGFGTLRAVRGPAASADGAPTVVFLQDAHGVPSAQTNIAESILKLSEDRPDLVVGLEGAAGPVDASPFRGPSAKVNRQLGALLFKADLIAGPELAAFAAPAGVRFTGVEDPGLYLRNVRAVENAFPRKAETAALLKRWAGRIDGLKASLWPKPLQELDRRRRDHEAGRLSLSDHVNFLASQSPAGALKELPQISLFQRVRGMESALDFQAVGRERATLLSRLGEKLSATALEELLEAGISLRLGRLSQAAYYRLFNGTVRGAGFSLSDFPRFQKYVEYVTASDAVRPEAFGKEVRVLEDRSARTLCGTPAQAELLDVSADMALAVKLVAFGMTPDEWKDYESRRRAVQDLPARVARLEGASPVPGGEEGLAFLGDFEEFYRVAEARNAALAENLLRAIAPAPSEAARKPPLAVFVCGGFHAEGLTDLLVRRGVWVAIVTPRIDDAELSVQRDSLAAFTRAPTPAEKLFQAPKPSLVTEEALSVAPLTRTAAAGKAVIAGIAAAALLLLSNLSVNQGEPGPDRPSGDQASMVEKMRVGPDGDYAATEVRSTDSDGNARLVELVVTSPGVGRESLPRQELAALAGGVTVLSVDGGEKDPSLSVVEKAPGAWSRAGDFLAARVLPAVKGLARLAVPAAAAFIVLTVAPSDALGAALDVPSADLLKASLINIPFLSAHWDILGAFLILAIFLGISRISRLHELEADMREETVGEMGPFDHPSLKGLDQALKAARGRSLTSAEVAVLGRSAEQVVAETRVTLSAMKSLDRLSEAYRQARVLALRAARKVAEAEIPGETGEELDVRMITARKFRTLAKYSRRRIRLLASAADFRMLHDGYGREKSNDLRSLWYFFQGTLGMHMVTQQVPALFPEWFRSGTEVGSHVRASLFREAEGDLAEIMDPAAGFFAPQKRSRAPNGIAEIWEHRKLSGWTWGILAVGIRYGIGKIVSSPAAGQNSIWVALVTGLGMVMIIHRAFIKEGLKRDVLRNEHWKTQERELETLLQGVAQNRARTVGARLPTLPPPPVSTRLPGAPRPLPPLPTPPSGAPVRRGAVPPPLPGRPAVAEPGPGALPSFTIEGDTEKNAAAGDAALQHGILSSNAEERIIHAASKNLIGKRIVAWAIATAAFVTVGYNFFSHYWESKNVSAGGGQILAPAMTAGPLGSAGAAGLSVQPDPGAMSVALPAPAASAQAAPSSAVRRRSKDARPAAPATGPSMASSPDASPVVPQVPPAAVTAPASPPSEEFDAVQALKAQLERKKREMQTAPAETRPDSSAPPAVGPKSGKPGGGGTQGSLWLPGMGGAAALVRRGRDKERRKGFRLWFTGLFMGALVTVQSLFPRAAGAQEREQTPIAAAMDARVKTSPDVLEARAKKNAKAHKAVQGWVTALTPFVGRKVRVMVKKSWSREDTPTADTVEVRKQEMFFDVFAVSPKELAENAAAVADETEAEAQELNQQAQAAREGLSMALTAHEAERRVFQARRALESLLGALQGKPSSKMTAAARVQLAALAEKQKAALTAAEADRDDALGRLGEDWSGGTGLDPETDPLDLYFLLNAAGGAGTQVAELSALDAKIEALKSKARAASWGRSPSARVTVVVKGDEKDFIKDVAPWLLVDWDMLSPFTVPVEAAKIWTDILELEAKRNKLLGDLGEKRNKAQADYDDARNKLKEADAPEAERRLDQALGRLAAGATSGDAVADFQKRSDKAAANESAQRKRMAEALVVLVTVPERLPAPRHDAAPPKFGFSSPVNLYLKTGLGWLWPHEKDHNADGGSSPDFWTVGLSVGLKPGLDPFLTALGPAFSLQATGPVDVSRYTLKQTGSNLGFNVIGSLTFNLDASAPPRKAVAEALKTAASDASKEDAAGAPAPEKTAPVLSTVEDVLAHALSRDKDARVSGPVARAAAGTGLTGNVAGVSAKARVSTAVNDEFPGGNKVHPDVRDAAGQTVVGKVAVAPSKMADRSLAEADKAVPQAVAERDENKAEAKALKELARFAAALAVVERWEEAPGAADASASRRVVQREDDLKALEAQQLKRNQDAMKALEAAGGATTEDLAAARAGLEDLQRRLASLREPLKKAGEEMDKAAKGLGLTRAQLIPAARDLLARGRGVSGEGLPSVEGHPDVRLAEAKAGQVKSPLQAAMGAVEGAFEFKHNGTNGKDGKPNVGTNEAGVEVVANLVASVVETVQAVSEKDDAGKTAGAAAARAGAELRQAARTVRGAARRLEAARAYLDAAKEARRALKDIGSSTVTLRELEMAEEAVAEAQIMVDREAAARDAANAVQQDLVRRAKGEKKGVLTAGTPLFSVGPLLLAFLPIPGNPFGGLLPHDHWVTPALLLVSAAALAFHLIRGFSSAAKSGQSRESSAGTPPQEKNVDDRLLRDIEKEARKHPSSDGVPPVDDPLAIIAPAETVTGGFRGRLEALRRVSGDS